MKLVIGLGGQAFYLAVVELMSAQFNNPCFHFGLLSHGHSNGSHLTWGKPGASDALGEAEFSSFSQSQVLALLHLSHLCPSISHFSSHLEEIILFSLSIRLQWVPGHSFLSSNDTANELTDKVHCHIYLQYRVFSLQLPLVPHFSWAGGVLLYLYLRHTGYLRIHEETSASWSLLLFPLPFCCCCPTPSERWGHGGRP